MTPSGALPAFLAKALETEQSDCLIWPFGRNKSGYAVMRPKRDQSEGLVHRLVCLKVHGPAPTKKHQAA
ncbi:MAG TPA: hypothetical protein VJM79_01220, partial [Rhizorhapis sp.]|nr:hypothetical protein [Rhizorhapis sp.]